MHQNGTKPLGSLLSAHKLGLYLWPLFLGTQSEGSLLLQLVV